MSTHPRPRLSIGFPVRNGEETIRRALDSLLAQTFTDFELIVVDNVSTDSTMEILESYRDLNPRIQIHQNPTNIGQQPNFDKVISLATGDYFMWASADDAWEPTFAASLIDLLDTSPQFEAATGAITRITPSNQIVDVIRFPLLKPLGGGGKLANALRIAAGYSNKKRYHLLFYSIFRRDFLTRGLPYSSVQTVYPDRTFMCQYALTGEFGYVDQPLMLKTAQIEAISSRFSGEAQGVDSDSAPWRLTRSSLAAIPFLLRSPIVPWYKSPLIFLVTAALLWGYKFQLYTGNSKWRLPVTLPLRMLRRVARVIVRRKIRRLPPPA